MKKSLPRIGVRLRYLGNRFALGPSPTTLLHAEAGDIATVVAKRAAISGTGVLLWQSEDGERLYDTGIPAWIIRL